MKVRIRSYCYGCRRGANWGRCIWRSHRFDWEWLIECDGRRLAQRGSFRTWGRARASATRAYARLAAVSCINVEEATRG